MVYENRKPCNQTKGDVLEDIEWDINSPNRVLAELALQDEPIITPIYSPQAESATHIGIQPAELAHPELPDGILPYA